MSQPNNNNNNATAPKLPSTNTPKLPIPPTTRTKKHIGGLKNIIHKNIKKPRSIQQQQQQQQQQKKAALTPANNKLMKEKFAKIDNSLKDLLKACKSNTSSFDYLKQYNLMMVNYQQKLETLKQQEMIKRSMNSVVSGFQAAAAAATRSPVTERRKSLGFNRSNQKRQIANQGSPKELLHQLEQMGIDQKELNKSFKKVYEEKMTQKDQDDGLNIERAKVLLLDAFESRDPNHILLSRFDIKMYQIMSSKLFAYFFTILAIIQLMFVAVEHCGWGLLSKNPDKYMWSFEILAPAEFVILSLYYIEFCFKSKIYKKIHPWLVTYGIITFVSIIDLIVASSSIDEDPRTVMRITRALRPFFLFHRWRPLRNMIHEIVTSIKKLIPVLIIIAFFIFLWALFGIMLFPRTCANLGVKMEMMPETCKNTDWITLFTPYNTSTIQNLNTTTIIDVQCQMKANDAHLCKQLKRIPNAYYSEGQTYFPNISVAYMQLLYLLFGSVNYPDIQLPAQLTIHIAYMLYFFLYIIIGIIFLNMMLAQVFEGWKGGAERLLLHATKKQRLALIECFILMDDDSSGTIDFKEFKNVVSAIRPNEENLLQIIFDRLNTDGTELDINEFMNVCNELWLKERSTSDYLVLSEYDMPETISSEIFTPEVIQHWHRAREYRKYKYEKHFKKHKKQNCRKCPLCCYKLCHGGLIPQLRVVLRQTWFEVIVLLVMIAAALTFYNEIYFTVQCNAEKQNLYHSLEWIPLILLLCETLIKILAVGIRGFLSVNTWKVDAFFVIAALIGQIMFGFAITKHECLGARSDDKSTGMSSFTLANLLRFCALLRLIRVFRFLSSRKSLPGSMTTRVMYKTFRSFLPSLCYFLVTYLCLIYMYAIIGVYFLGNKVYSDGANDIGGIAGAGEFSIVDDNIKINVKSPYLTGITFNTFVGAFFALWSVTILNNWHIVHHAYANTTTNGSDSEVVMVTIYFVTWILLSAMVWLNLLVSAFLDHYSTELEFEKKISSENLYHQAQHEKEKYEIPGSDEAKNGGKLSQYTNGVKHFWVRFMLFCEESLGTTKICTLSGQAMSSYSCPVMILPQIFDSPQPMPVSVVEFLNLCDEDGKMENRRFTLAKQQSIAKMDYQNEEGKSGKAESLILIRKQSSGSVGSRDSSSNNIDRISLLDQSNGGGDGRAINRKKNSFEVGQM